MDYFSKDDLKNEIRGYMWALAACLERAYFPGCSWGLLGLDPNDFPGQRIDDLHADAIDISRFLVTDVLMELYDYGINGERRGNWNWIDLATDTLAFIDGLRHFLLLHEGSVDYQLELSSHVLAVADARDKLDEEEGHTDALDEKAASLGVRLGVLTLAEIALLANMDEKSVRNAANHNNKNRLKTFNHGARTYVYAEDARAWLAGRRGFKPTRYVASSTDRDLTETGFYSADDLAGYLKAQREKKGLSIPDVMAAMDVPGQDKSGVEDLEKGDFFFDSHFYRDLAGALSLDVKAFVFAGMNLAYKLERARLEEELGEFDQKGAAPQPEAQVG